MIFFPSEIVVVPVVFGIPSAVIALRMILKHREKMEALQHDASAPAADDTRLARIEQAIEAMAIEMERVGEHQRFMTNVLSERTNVAADPAALHRGRTITPH